MVVYPNVSWEPAIGTRILEGVAIGMRMPSPTPIYRLMHLDNLPVVLARGGMHAPNHVPSDGLAYRTIHKIEIQEVRRQRVIPCGPGGTVHDYVSFYLGPRAPMLLQLHTGRVAGYREGQAPLIYVVSTVQAIVSARLGFVFSDGHGITSFTRWFDHVSKLVEVDWNMVYADYWADDMEDMDRQRRKQAEFLVCRFCPWHMVNGIGVFNSAIQRRVEAILADHGTGTPTEVRANWYY